MTDQRSSTALKFGKRKSETHYTLWIRRKGAGTWQHRGTPDANHAEERVPVWAADNPGYEYKLVRERVIEEEAVVSA